MALRTILINLRETEEITNKGVSELKNYIEPFFVMTKLNNGEIQNVVRPLLKQFNEEKISMWSFKRQVISLLTENVSESSYKVINLDVDLISSKEDNNNG
jgi:hypothetical protein